MVQIEEFKDDPMEQLLGERLIVSGEKKALVTADALKGKELVLLYFSAAWCPVSDPFDDTGLALLIIIGAVSRYQSYAVVD